MLVGIGQQSQVARALDRRGKLSLETRARAGDARRHDLAVLGNVLLEHVEILVIDLGNAFSGESATALLADIAGHLLQAPVVAALPDSASSVSSSEISFSPDTYRSNKSSNSSESLLVRFSVESAYTVR